MMTIQDHGVTQEKTGWRDLGLSMRHRTWGSNVPALDLDLIEYDGGRAIALIEYVRETGGEKAPQGSNMRALVDLGNRAGLPVYVVRYAIDFSWFLIQPMNAQANKRRPALLKVNELEYVSFLYRLRGRSIPEEVSRRITGEPDPQQ